MMRFSEDNITRNVVAHRNRLPVSRRGLSSPTDKNQGKTHEHNNEQNIRVNARSECPLVMTPLCVLGRASRSRDEGEPPGSRENPSDHHNLTHHPFGAQTKMTHKPWFPHASHHTCWCTPLNRLSNHSHVVGLTKFPLCSRLLILSRRGMVALTEGARRKKH